MGDDIVLTLNSIAKINSIKNNSIKLHYIFKMKKIDSRYLGFNPMLSVTVVSIILPKSILVLKHLFSYLATSYHIHGFPEMFVCISSYSHKIQRGSHKYFCV